MSRIKLIVIIGITIIIVGGFSLVLLNNRARINAKSRNDFQTSIPVSVIEVRLLNLAENLSLIGTITANNDIAIVSETQGRVTAVHARVGDYKRAGSPLIQVDDEVKKAAWEQAEVKYNWAKRDYERFTSLRNEQAVTEAQKENAYAAFKVAEAQYILARRQYRDTKISTPISGIVSARNVDVGGMVADKMVVANVVDVSTLKVKLSVAEQDAFKLKAGDKVDVSTEVYPGVRFEGRITSISAKADEGHTYPVEIMMDNSKTHPLKAGMFGRVSFVSIAPSTVLAIPREALVGSMREPRVFVIGGSTARLREIIVGSQVGTNLTVLGGLKAGESVVVNGQNNLKDSVAVEVLK